ncbi:MAG: DUF3179 domain-containing protein [Chloroflexi bacterium]|nr:DUF3179 domain-containing protein [Chloroflexota bacterium]
MPKVAAPTPTVSGDRTPGARPTATPVSGVIESTETPILEVSTREWRSTNFRRYTVAPSEILPGGPGKNGILPIYEPQFVSIGTAETWEWMTPAHPVAVLERNGDARAYPLGILTLHEIVNDTVGGEPILVTYCPLCYTTLGFKRMVDGTVLVFGTTGNLRNSNLVMWDDATESWWQQATGEAILGDMAGKRLELVPMFTTSLAEFKASYPQGRVLSPDSAPSEYRAYYGSTFYVGYDAPNNLPLLFQGRVDQRLPAMERVLVLESGKTAVAFPFAYLGKQPATQTTLEGQPVVLFWKEGTASALDKQEVAKSRDVGSAAAFDPRVNGRVLTFSYQGGAFRDTETGSRWSLLGRALEGPLAGTQLRPLGGKDGFWFVWAAFRPAIRVYRPETTGGTGG